MEKIHELHGYKYFYSKRDRTWLIITPEGEELNGGDKGQTIFWINWKIGQK